MYGSEVFKAKKVMHENKWWMTHQGKTFILPYTRSDSFVAKINDKIRNGCSSKTVLKDNCIYSKQTNMCHYTIPEEIPLDYNFGYLVGAYAAEGCMTNTQISISNNDVEYFKPILELCKKWNINTKIYKTENKLKEGWTTQDLRIYNTLVCRILENLSGKLSHNKFISDKIIFSNKECLLGFMDAYIGGDGYINVKQKIISISSVSQNMLIDVQQILNILDTYSYIKKYKKPETNNRGSKNIKQLYNLIIPGSQLHKFASILNIKIDYKQNNLLHILKHKYVYNIHKNDTIIPDEIDGNMIYKERVSNECKDILFDKIKSIEEVPNTTNYAYDLTIEGTRTFNIYNSLAMFDTFHFAGVASKSNVTRGVPRIEEILSLSAELKNPSLTVFLKPEDETDKDKAHSIMYMLEHTKLQEVVKSINICFDPDDLNTLIEEDKDTMTQYRDFESLVDKCLDSQTGSDTEKSKWIIRMEIDPEVMLEKNITMDDINFTLNSVYQDEISCVYSDFNSDKLVFRIRMNNILKQSASKSNLLKKGKVNPLDQSDQIYILKNFQDQLLQNIVLRGIKKINKVILRKIKDNLVEKSGSYKKQEIWVLDTIGTNLLDVLGLDYIDSTRTLSNDIIEIFDVLGIEAARRTIYNELADVIEFDGTYLNYHHMALLCDRMTANIKLVSIFRHGINNDNIGPIAKASFEETPEMFLKAARHAELDTMRGVSANVMCGQEGFVGTSAFQVVLDIKEMSNLEQKIRHEISDAEEMINKDLFGTFDNPEDPCSINKLSIDNNVVNIKTEQLGEDNDDYNPFE
jgi:DNA-directed RNA polymerase beta' subunit